MRHRSLGPLLAVAISACTFTTADVGPTATSLRTAHDALAREFSEIDANAIPSEVSVNDVCRTYQPPPATNENFDPFTIMFCQQWSGATPAQRAQMTKELALSGQLNDALAQLLGYVEALDQLVKSRERSAVQAELLSARLEGLETVARALGASEFLTAPVRSGFLAAVTALDQYRLTRSALRASEHAQRGLDLFAISVRSMLGECDIALNERQQRIYAAEFSTTPCDSAVKARWQEATAAIANRMAASARLHDSEAFRTYSVRAPGAYTALRRAYEARATAIASNDAAAQGTANDAIDVALRDIEAMERLRPRYDAVVSAQQSAEQWRIARDRGRRAAAQAFVRAADQNAQLSDAIRRDRQLDLGPIGFVLRSLLGAI